jgi:hypothetical protein
MMQRLADRTAIIREMRVGPAIIADELFELRAGRDRAERLMAGEPPSTNLGAGIQLGARIILGRVHDPEVWVRALTNLGDDLP